MKLRGIKLRVKKLKVVRKSDREEKEEKGSLRIWILFLSFRSFLYFWRFDLYYFLS